MKHRIITINRLYGSNGRRIGKKLAARLGIHFYDKELIRLASEKKDTPISYEELVELHEKRLSEWKDSVNVEQQIAPKFRYESMNEVLFKEEQDVIKEIAQREDAVIIGRCANYFLEDQCRSVFVYASAEDRIHNIMKRTSADEKTARQLIKKMDKQRGNFYNYYTDEKWNDMQQYNLCIDSGSFAEDEIVDIIVSMYEHME